MAHTQEFLLLVSVADFHTVLNRGSDRAHALFQALFNGESVWSGHSGIRHLLQPKNLSVQVQDSIVTKTEDMLTF